MEWIWILLLVFAAFGGVAYAWPSKQTRLISKLRQLARQRNISVSMMAVPDFNASPDERVTLSGKDRKPTLQCVIYRRVRNDERADGPRWRLLRDGDSAEPVSGWRLHGYPVEGVLKFDYEYWKEVEKTMGLVPDDCIGLESTANHTGWIGRENLANSTPEEFLVRLDSALKVLPTSSADSE